MTALELADKLDETWFRWKDHKITELEAADMLRTQHALIEDLQKALREVPNTQLHYADHIRRQHEAIKQLREALENTHIQYDYHGNPMEDCDRMVLAALKDTEGL